MSKFVSKMVFLFVFLILFSSPGSLIQTSDLHVITQTVPDYGKIPLYFIPNRGQVDAKALFYAKASAYTLWITHDGLLFDQIGKREKTKPNNRTAPAKKSGDTEDSPYERDISKVVFFRAARNPGVVPLGPTAHKISYFVGNDQSQWKTGIPTSNAVLYKGLYEGIDLKIYGVEKQIEYDFIVHPSGKTSDIQFAYENIDKADIDREGALLIKTDFGTLKHAKPLAYQMIRGEKVSIPVDFKNIAANTYGFEVAKYDPDHDLVIDPLVLIYSTFLGGQDNDYGHAIAVDKAGSAYVTGQTFSMNFPTNVGFSGKCDAFVSKISPEGGYLVYSIFLGGSGKDSGNGIAVDENGAVYVVGDTFSSDFPTRNPVYANFSGRGDAFIAKINPNGTALVYSTYLGGTKNDYCNGIAVNKKGEAYVAGMTLSSDFPTENPIFENNSGGYDAFVAKIRPKGTSLIYSTYLGGSGADAVHGIAVDGNGAAYLTGQTSSADFPTQNPIYAMLWGGSDAFVTKIDPDGMSIVYSTYLGGSNSEIGYGIAVNKKGAAYVTGETKSSDFPTEKPICVSNAGSVDVFVTKINSPGNALVYSTYLGGEGMDSGSGIAVDKKGAAYVAGHLSSLSFTSGESGQSTSSEKSDPAVNDVVSTLGFVAKIDTKGSMILYAEQLEDAEDTEAFAVAVDDQGAAYVTGKTGSFDFPTLRPAYPYKYGRNDAFIAKLQVIKALAVPTLIYPANGAVLDNGRTDGRDDIIWDFYWSNCLGASKYQLYVFHKGSEYPAIDRIVTYPEYHIMARGAYIIDSNRFNWTWKVRAGSGDFWTKWSQVRGFTVEPVNTDRPK